MIPVLLEHDAALPLVHCSLALRIGSVVDPPGKEGLTRLLFRLMRRTGGGATPRVLDERIDRLGAAIWVDVGQSTSGVHGTTISRNLDAFLDVLSDVVLKPGLDAEEFERLKREALSELVEVLDSDRSLARRWFARRLFAGHPYARPTGGTKTTLAAIQLEDLQQRYRELFCPENLVLAVAGDIDEATARAFAERLSATLPRGNALTDPTPEPTQRPGRHLVFVDKPERTQTQILIGCLGSHPHDPDHIPLHVANTVFGGTFTSRLTQEVRGKRGWSYGAYASLPVDRRRRSFSMWTFPKADDALACIQLELELFEAWVREGITQEELDWVKAYLVRSHAFAVDSSSKRVGQLLDMELYGLPDGYHTEYTQRVAAVTLSQANQSLRRLTPKDLLISVVGSKEPIFDALKAGIPHLESSEVIPFDTD
ncbi:MAG: M16 family metallopeptidase [Polyangiaceae bacterium]